jgi:hypothetical protein
MEDLTTVQTALKTWVRSLTGIASTDVVLFENEPRVHHNGTLVLLSWLSDVGVGTHETRYEDSEEAPPAPNMTPVLVGCSLITLQISVETHSQDPAIPSARVLSMRLRDRVRRPSSLALLASLNLGLVSVAPIRQVDYRVDRRMVARMIVEVGFNATSFDRDTDSSVGSLETIEVTSVITAPSGDPVSSDLQLTEEVMP